MNHTVRWSLLGLVVVFEQFSLYLLANDKLLSECEEVAQSTSARAEIMANSARASVSNTVTWSEIALRDAIETIEGALVQISDARILLADVAVALAKRANDYDRTALDPSFNNAPTEWQAKSTTWVELETQMRHTMGEHERNLASFYLAAMHASADSSTTHDRFGAALLRCRVAPRNRRRQPRSDEFAE